MKSEAKHTYWPKGGMSFQCMNSIYRIEIKNNFLSKQFAFNVICWAGLYKVNEFNITI